MNNYRIYPNIDWNKRILRNVNWRDGIWGNSIYYTLIKNLSDNQFVSCIQREEITNDNNLFIEKIERYKKVGLSNSINVKQYEDEIKKLENLIKENEIKLETIYAIDYFKLKYPLYSLITNDKDLKDFLSYNDLIIEDIYLYTGYISYDHLLLLENFAIEQKDSTFSTVTKSNNISYNDFIIHKNLYEDYYHMYEFTYEEVPLQIVAKREFFRRGNTITSDDIIILKMVHYNNKFYYLIVN